MANKEKKKLSKRIIALIVCAVLIAVILFTCLGLQIAFVIADGDECWHSDYNKEDLTGVLDKPELSDSDYEFLYRQTGLTKLGINRALARGNSGKARIKKIQDCFFTEYKVINGYFAPFICTDRIDGQSTYVYPETGDILITSSTHISGWRMGHCSLVTNGASGQIAEANAYGTYSKKAHIDDYTDRLNFMILSPKTDTATKQAVADYVLAELLGIPYDATVGVFSNKNSISKTNCSHLVWYAYNKFGIDLDSNGGLIVTPHDIAVSPELEIVQVFGFDPYRLWQ